MIKETRIIMGMPIVLMAHDKSLTTSQIKKIFDFFSTVDRKYSPYISDSQVSKLQKTAPFERRYTAELASILILAEQTKQETNGYFDVEYNGVFDPTGIVKGWALQKVAELLEGYTSNFYIEAGGDIQVHGVAEHGEPWRIGVRSPFNRFENVAIVSLDNKAIATSGTAIRGAHIYDPVSNEEPQGIASLSVIAPRIVDADRMATAAFAMGEKGIYYIEQLKGFEAFMINSKGIATQTTGWREFEVVS